MKTNTKDNNNKNSHSSIMQIIRLRRISLNSSAQIKIYPDKLLAVIRREIIIRFQGNSSMVLAPCPGSKVPEPRAVILEVPGIITRLRMRSTTKKVNFSNAGYVIGLQCMRMMTRSVWIIRVVVIMEESRDQQNNSIRRAWNVIRSWVRWILSIMMFFVRIAITRLKPLAYNKEVSTPQIF